MSVDVYVIAGYEVTVLFIGNGIAIILKIKSVNNEE